MNYHKVSFFFINENKDAIEIARNIHMTQVPERNDIIESFAGYPNFLVSHRVIDVFKDEWKVYIVNLSIAKEKEEHIESDN